MAIRPKVYDSTVFAISAPVTFSKLLPKMGLALAYAHMSKLGITSARAFYHRRRL